MKILNYGSMNVDYVYEVRHIVRGGETIHARGRNIYPGGKGLNQSIAAARAGGDVFHIGVLGADGQVLEKALEENRIHMEHIKRIPGNSAHTVIQVDQNGQNCIIVFAGKEITFTEGEMDEILTHFDAGDAVIFQNELDGSPVFMRKAADAGLVIIFNPSPMEDAVELRRFYGRYAADPESMRIEGTIEFFRKASKVAPCAIVSGSPHDDVVAAAKLCGIDGCTALVLGAGEYERGKPSPSGFLRAAEILEVDPRDCVVIEDSEVGVASGVAAGMKVVGLDRARIARQHFTGETWRVSDMSQIDFEKEFT